MDAVRVVVADDQAAFREVAGYVIDEAAGLEFVGSVDRVSAIPRLIDESGADALLLDVRMPGEDSLAMAADLRRSRPGLRILLVSADSIEDIPQEVFALGIGFLAKEDLCPISLRQSWQSLRIGGGARP